MWSSTYLRSSGFQRHRGKCGECSDCGSQGSLLRKSEFDSGPVHRSPTTGPGDHRRSRQKLVISGCSTFDREVRSRYDKICGREGGRTRLKLVNEHGLPNREREDGGRTRDSSIRSIASVWGAAFCRVGAPVCPVFGHVSNHLSAHQPHGSTLHLHHNEPPTVFL